MAQDTSAYKFSLFGSYDNGSAAPQLEPEFEPVPQKRKAPKKTAKKQHYTVSKAERNATRASSVKIIKALLIVFCLFSVICIPMYLNVKLDETAKEISAVQAQIDIAKSENIRLESTLEGMVSIDKIEDFAENNLGMVKLENYRITYFNSDAGNHVVISGGKSYRNSGSAEN